MDTASCEIGRLPEELLVRVISLTSPVAACHAAAVSRAFRAAADSDDVWSCFVPRELPWFAKKQISPATASKKALFRRLSCLIAFLPRKLMHMRLDKATGAKCFMLSAEILQITKYRRYVRDLTPSGFDYEALNTSKRFPHVVTFRKCGKIEIRGKIHCKMLSENVTYAAYMVFKLHPTSFCGLDYPFQEASVSVGGHKSISQVCLQSCVEDEGDGGESPRIHVLESSAYRLEWEITLGDDMAIPQRRDDGWMEVELGEFYNEEGCDGEVLVSLTETSLTNKRGLIFFGIEFRNKIQKPTRLPSVM